MAAKQQKPSTFTDVVHAEETIEHPFRTVSKIYQNRFKSLPDNVPQAELFRMGCDIGRSSFTWATRMVMKISKTKLTRIVLGRKTMKLLSSTTLDLRAKTLTINSRNENRRRRIKFKDDVVFSVHPENPQWTIMRSTKRVWVSVFCMSSRLRKQVMRLYEEFMREFMTITEERLAQVTLPLANKHRKETLKSQNSEADEPSDNRTLSEFSTYVCFRTHDLIGAPSLRTRLRLMSAARSGVRRSESQLATLSGGGACGIKDKCHQPGCLSSAFIEGLIASHCGIPDEEILELRWLDLSPSELKGGENIDGGGTPKADSETEDKTTMHIPTMTNRRSHSNRMPGLPEDPEKAIIITSVFSADGSSTAKSEDVISSDSIIINLKDMDAETNVGDVQTSACDDPKPAH
eukprot:149658_1